MQIWRYKYVFTVNTARKLTVVVRSLPLYFRYISVY